MIAHLTELLHEGISLAADNRTESGGYGNVIARLSRGDVAAIALRAGGGSPRGMLEL